MKLVRAVILASALACASPLLAQELTVSALKAFTAKMDAAAASCDIDTIVNHVAELAAISVTHNRDGGMQILRMNKTKYRAYLTVMCAAMSNYQYARTNEKITIDGDQAVITADVSESMVIQGQEFKATVREKATIESIDGKLMLVQLLANQVM